MAMKKYNEYLQVNPSFESVVDIAADSRNKNLWRQVCGLLRPADHFLLCILFPQLQIRRAVSDPPLCGRTDPDHTF